MRFTEKYSHEFNKFEKFCQKWLGMWRINRDSIDFKWGYFAPRFNITLMYNHGGYETKQSSLSIGFIWGYLNIRLPIRSNKEYSMDNPRYGFQTHDNTIMFYWGKKSNGGTRLKMWDIPFISYKFKSFEILTTRGMVDTKVLEKETKWYMDHPDILNNSIQVMVKDVDGHTPVNVTYTVEKRTWTRKWMPLIKLVRTDIHMKFDKELGSKKNTWKGGTVGKSIKCVKDQPYELTITDYFSEYEFD